MNSPRFVPATCRYGPHHTSPPACTSRGLSCKPCQVRSGTTSSTCRYSRVSMSTIVIRLPWFSSSTVFEYQLVISSRRPPMSSSSLASADVVMPWGHQRSELPSASFQRNPHSTACPGTRACRPGGSGGRVRRRCPRADRTSPRQRGCPRRSRRFAADGCSTRCHRSPGQGRPRPLDCPHAARWWESRCSGTAGCSPRAGPARRRWRALGVPGRQGRAGGGTPRDRRTRDRRGAALHRRGHRLGGCGSVKQGSAQARSSR